MDDHLTTKPQLDSSVSPNGSNETNARSSGTEENAERPVRSSSEPINLDLQPKPSSAVIVWMLVVAVVLAVLGYQMHGDKHPAYNVVISLNGDVADCEIIVDGEPRGKFNPNSGGEHTAWLKVDNGKHHIDIKKSGQPFQSRDFEVKGKEYLRFDSGSTSEPN